MSDYADNADSRIYRTIAADLAAARCARPLLADFHCHFCDEPIGIELLFCDSDCRDDFNAILPLRGARGSSPSS